MHRNIIPHPSFHLLNKFAICLQLHCLLIEHLWCVLCDRYWYSPAGLRTWASAANYPYIATKPQSIDGIPLDSLLTACETDQRCAVFDMHGYMYRWDDANKDPPYLVRIIHQYYRYMPTLAGHFYCPICMPESLLFQLA